MITIRIGYVPLTDAAVLIAAAERGFAQRHGISLELEREPSWATLRDKLALGHVDGAHLLAPLAVAMVLGLGPTPVVPLTVPFLLNLNGNAVTVSTSLWADMGEPGGGLAKRQVAFGVAGRRRADGGHPFVLATVFPFSTHTHLLRRFLAGSGLDAGRDITITVVPPPYAAEALAKGAVDGFCVGSPWNSVAVAAGAGRIVALGSDLLRDAPEKVLALLRGRVEPEAVGGLVAALKEAAAWCGDPDNHEALAGLLAQRRHLGLDAGLILRSLSGRLLLGPAGPEIHAPDYLRLGGEMHRPGTGAADRILSEMEASGQVTLNPASRAIVGAMFDPASFDCF
jgi:NitT/TauT family transport system ATP-binding protein